MDVPTAPDDALDGGITGAHHNVVSSLPQTFLELLGEVFLDSDVVGVELMVETRVLYRFAQLLAKVQYVQNNLQQQGD